MRLHEFVVFLRIQRRSTFDPRVNRVRGDHVKFLLGRENEMPRVSVNDVRPRFLHDVVILRTKELRRSRRDHSFQFTNNKTLDLRIRHKGSRRNSGTETDNKYRTRIRME